MSERLTYASEDLDEAQATIAALQKRIGKLEASGLVEALEQALDCICGETPEDMSHEEARQDTVEKIRAALRAHAADRSAT